MVLATCHSSLRPIPYFCGPLAIVKTVARDRLFRQRAASSFREQHIFAQKLHPPRESRLRMTVAIDAHIARRDAENLTLVAVRSSVAANPG